MLEDVWYVRSFPKLNFTSTTYSLKSHCHCLKLRLPELNPSASFFFSLSPPLISTLFLSLSFSYYLNRPSFLFIQMWVCLQPSCYCEDFVPLRQHPKTCSLCCHQRSSHFGSPSDGEDGSGDNETIDVGTHSYVERLQRDASESAVVEAIGET